MIPPEYYWAVKVTRAELIYNYCDTNLLRNINIIMYHYSTGVILVSKRCVHVEFHTDDLPLRHGRRLWNRIRRGRGRFADCHWLGVGRPFESGSQARKTPWRKFESLKKFKNFKKLNEHFKWSICMDVFHRWKQ